jgi:hypothetical protein
MGKISAGRMDDTVLGRRRRATLWAVMFHAD